jgi:hypothetical protein
MSDEPAHSGRVGVIMHGGTISPGRDFISGDKFELSTAAVSDVLHPISDLVESAPPTTRSTAALKLNELKEELTKGSAADDSKMAGLADGLVGLIPSGVSAVVKAFGAPLISGIAGPVTQYVLKKIQGL